MADNLRAWRNAAHELPPEGVPVYGILADGTGGWYERARDDDGNGVWAESERIFWDRQDKAWSADGAYYDDDYRVRYWHPLPDVPTLAELDAHRDERATDAATAAASEGGGAVRLQRWNVGRGGLDTADVFDDKGEWVRWADVLAWRDSIRAAVAAERHAAFVYERAYDAERNGRPTPTGSVVRFAEWNAARAATEAALDALLADGDCQTMDTSRTQAIAEAHQRALSDEMLSRMLRDGDA